MNKSEWTNKDWKWLIRILIGIISILVLIIITVVAIKLSDNIELVNVISIGAGLVSMVLGIIAIIYAFVQTKESGEQNRQLKNTMHEIDKRVYKLDDIIKQINTVQDEIEHLKFASTDKLDSIVDLMIDLKNFKNSNEYKKLDENNKLRKDINTLYEELYSILDQLTPAEEKVLRLRFGSDDGRSRCLEEVAAEFSVTKEKIRQVEAKALRKLGTIFLNEKLNEINREMQGL